MKKENLTDIGGMVVTKPEFEVFEKEGFFFFQIKDASGSPVLFSQPYNSVEKRAAGMDIFQRNASESRQYVKLEADGQFYFAVKAGNHKEIARSRPYHSATARNAAMKEVQNNWSVQVVEAAEFVVESNSPTTATTPSHYRFVLSFYPEKPDGKLRGKIEYPLVKDEKESFDGIDLERIGRFIDKRLPKPEAPKPAPKAQGIPILRNLDVLENGRVTPSRRVNPVENIEVRMALSGQDKTIWEGKSYKATLSLKSLEHHSETTMISKEGTLPPGGELCVKAPTYNLSAGLYRIVLHAELEEPGKRLQNPVWEGDSLMLIS